MAYLSKARTEQTQSSPNLKLKISIDNDMWKKAGQVFCHQILVFS